MRVFVINLASANTKIVTFNSTNNNCMWSTNSCLDFSLCLSAPLAQENEFLVQRRRVAQSLVYDVTITEGPRNAISKTNNFSVCSSVSLAQGNEFLVQVYRVAQRWSYAIVLTKYTNTLCESNRVLAPVNLRDYKRICWLQGWGQEGWLENGVGECACEKIKSVLLNSGVCQSCILGIFKL